MLFASSKRIFQPASMREIQEIQALHDSLLSLGIRTGLTREYTCRTAGVSAQATLKPWPSQLALMWRVSSVLIEKRSRSVRESRHSKQTLLVVTSFVGASCSVLSAA